MIDWIIPKGCIEEVQALTGQYIREGTMTFFHKKTYEKLKIYVDKNNQILKND